MTSIDDRRCAGARGLEVSGGRVRTRGEELDHRKKSGTAVSAVGQADDGGDHRPTIGRCPNPWENTLAMIRNRMQLFDDVLCP